MGDPEWIERALCVDVPVLFPGNANFMLTFPVEQGDECLLLFAERCIDGWYSEGGVQEQAELRHHDASDGIAIVGLRSQPKRIKNFDKERLQIRNKEGDTVVTLDKEGIVTVDVSGTTMVVEDGRVTVTADAIKLDGDVEVTGDIDVRGDADVGGDLTGQGDGKFPSGDVKASGVSLTNHVHTGVMTGGGTSGPPMRGA